MSRYILSDEARHDLYQIWEYVAEQGSIDAADRVIGDLRDAMMKLAESPLIGHRRQDLTSQPVRFWSVHSYLVVYDPDTDPLVIVRVLHGFRDIQAIL